MNSTTPYLYVALFFSLFFSSTSSNQQINPQHSQILDFNSKVARLELQLERIDEELYLKSLHIEKCEKKIEELNNNIHHLEFVLSASRDEPDYESMIKMFEEQVLELEAGVKKNDLDFRLLKLKAKDDEKLVKSLASQLDLMVKVVPELWFHVQKLEQAREVIERRTIELRRHIRNQRCPFFKFINKFPERHYVNMVASYASEVFVNQLRWSYSALKKYHHQLQGFFTREMKKNKFIAVLADAEFVFILVSIVFVYPVILTMKWFLPVIFMASSVVIFLFMLVLRLLSLVTLLASAVAIFSLMVALR